jgi:hypothetical protein
MWRFTAMPLALAGVAMIPFASCNVADTLCCSDFTPGADLSEVDWGMTGEAELDYGAFMQATADFTGTATAVVTDVANSCQAIAIDLGSEPNVVTASEPSARATGWCNEAVTKINAAKASGSLTIRYQPPSCTISANVQANCEAKCSANVTCEITPAQIILRCTPGELSGKCEGQCTGKCEGSANLAVNCEGVCEGTCEGQCAGNCSAQTAMGECRGYCDSTCTGQCRGSCAIEATSNVQCNADCTGGCDVMITAPKCKGELTPPSAECEGSASCSGSCQASASAKAECKEPSLEIEADAGLEGLVTTLKLNLPKIISVFKVRGDLLVSNATAVGSLAGTITVDGTKAIACLIPAGDAILQAGANLEASVSASASVSGAVGVN